MLTNLQIMMMHTKLYTFTLNVTNLQEFACFLILPSCYLTRNMLTKKQKHRTSWVQYAPSRPCTGTTVQC